jgi:hypothetical protein
MSRPNFCRYSAAMRATCSAAYRRAQQRRKRTGGHRRQTKQKNTDLRLLAVDAQNRRTDALEDVRAVARRASMGRPSRKADLIIDHHMHRATHAESREIGQQRSLRHDPLRAASELRPGLETERSSELGLTWPGSEASPCTMTQAARRRASATPTPPATIVSCAQTVRPYSDKSDPVADLTSADFAHSDGQRALEMRGVLQQ